MTAVFAVVTSATARTPTRGATQTHMGKTAYEWHKIARQRLDAREWYHSRLGAQIRQNRQLQRKVKLLRQALTRIGALPAHDALWECIHQYEGSWDNRDTGNNGHYGGLQMHPGWGYGTSYYASDNTALEQKQAAERGYRASGYSRSWLTQQWGQTIGPCWQFAE